MGDLIDCLHAFCHRTTEDDALAVAQALKSAPDDADSSSVMASLPLHGNGDARFIIGQAMLDSRTTLSWSALGWALEATARAVQRQKDLTPVLLWSGPRPAGGAETRRVDQILYDLIAGAVHEVLLVTFAAARIAHLNHALEVAIGNGVRPRLALEFREESSGQLSYDAARAFSATVLGASDVYCWPLEQRERNESNRPGKLHAKAAVIDGCAIVSSANLTDDAFNRNLELGVLFRGGDIVDTVRQHFEALIDTGTLRRLPSLTSARSP